jgi:hypothetical protein
MTLEALHGIPLMVRVSSLRWPNQQRPPTKSWEIWTSALRTLQPRNTLLIPLGLWTTHLSHQSWNWYHSAHDTSLYRQDHSTDTWTKYNGIPNPKRSTRSAASVVFNTTTGQPCPRPPAALLPASVNQGRCNDLLTATPGPPKPAPPLPKPTASTVPGLLLEDAYYSSFYKSYRFPNTAVYETIAQECPSGISVLYRSYYDIEGISYGWTIYSSSSNAILDTGVVSRGFVPHVSSMQRTELEAVLNVLSLLTCIHQCYSVTHSKIDVYCLLKATTRLMRSLLYHSVSSALDDHGDLLAELSYILQVLSSKSKIHYKYLNLAAEENGSPIPLRYISQLGTGISSHRDEINAFPLLQDYINPSRNTIQLGYKDRQLLTKIKSIIRKELYSAAIQDTICKQEDWTYPQFHSIDWDALEYALSQTWSCKHITYTKLTHKLLNTNVQNHKFYKKSALCPCCASSPETLMHMLSCPSTEVAAF